MINPSIWTNRKFIRCSAKEKLLYIGLFSTADDHGKLWYDILAIKASIFPCDDLSEDEIKESLGRLSDLQLIKTDEKVIKIHGWNIHQSVPKPQESSIPEPLPIHCSNNTEPLPNCYGITSEPSPDQCSIVSESLPTKERKKERNKRKKETKESNLSLINNSNEKEISTKEVMKLLLENREKFTKTEYADIKSLIEQEKHLSARIKIDEKITIS